MSKRAERRGTRTDGRLDDGPNGSLVSLLRLAAEMPVIAGAALLLLLFALDSTDLLLWLLLLLLLRSDWARVVSRD